MTDMLAEKIVAATGAGMGIGGEVAILCADESKDISGEVLSVRKNEGFLFSKPYPIRGIRRAEGGVPGSTAFDLYPAFSSSFTKLVRSTDVFNWDSV